MKKVTMQDIAERLNLSKNSVSQALRDKAGVSPETKRRVEEAAEQLGYRYNSAAKALKTNSMGNIGLIASEFVFTEDTFFGQINFSIEKEIKKRNYSLLIHAVDAASERELKLPPFLAENKVDGVLILSHLSLDYIRQVRKLGLPTVLIDHHHPQLPIDCVLTNNRFGAYDAVRHLLELGHVKIGFMGNTAVSPSYRERLDGYRNALEDAGVEVEPAFLHTDVEEAEYDLSARLKRLEDMPTAWFCANDTIGLLLANSLSKLGLSVPLDVSICGFDNNRLAEYANPSLTTISIDKELFGKRAVERLFWRKDNPIEPPEELLLPASLLVRHSTAPCREAPWQDRAEEDEGSRRRVERAEV